VSAVPGYVMLLYWLLNENHEMHNQAPIYSSIILDQKFEAILYALQNPVASFRVAPGQRINQQVLI